MTVHSFNKLQQILYAQRTGFTVDIQGIGKNTLCLARKEVDSLREIRPGVWFQTTPYTFSDGNFTNIYNLFWDPSRADIQPSVHTSNKPYYLLNQARTDPSIIATINGSFFFLTDQADRKPMDLQYDLCIRDSVLFGLPSTDGPIAFMQNGKLDTAEPRAQGIIMIRNIPIHWIGARSELALENDRVLLYNSRCSEIIKVRDPQTNLQIGILNNKNITTPLRPDAVDVVIGSDRYGRLHITHINRGGGTHYFDGLFILQMRGEISKFQVRDYIEPISLDGLDLRPVTSAITIGRRVDDPFFHAFERQYRRDARSVLAQDAQGYIHFIVFDGSKYIPGFNGVSANDMNSFFPPEQYKWAYFLDGGGSSRIIVRENGQLKIAANEFAFRKLKDGSVVWDWEKGRLLVSSLALRIAGN